MVKKRKLRDLVLPNKKINFFIVTILIFGMVSGSIFLMVLSKSDQNNIILQIQNFFQNVSNGSIDSGLAFKNSLIINYLFVLFIWFFGLSIIGIIFNIFLTYIKGFLVGFSISAIILTYGYKGIIAALLYSFFSQVFNVLVIIVLAIYSIMFSFSLLKVIIGKRVNHKIMLKKYLVILMFSVIISFFSSVFEIYLFPNILKLLIRIYV